MLLHQHLNEFYEDSDVVHLNQDGLKLSALDELMLSGTKLKTASFYNNNINVFPDAICNHKKFAGS